MVAPNGARPMKKDHPAVPITIFETAETAKACFDAGADGIHFHMRDQKEQHILDSGLCKEALSELQKKVPKMHLQLTTEAVGRYSPDAMRKLASEIKMLADRYMATTDSGESWLPLLPELLDLQTDVKHILNIPICMERMKNALSMYTDIDIDELQDLMTKLAEGNLNNAIQTARSWFEDSAIKPSE